MKQFLKFSSLSLLFLFIFSACSTSNSVVSNRMIQKRKYNSGFHVDAGPKLGNKKQSENIKIENIQIEEVAEVPTANSIATESKVENTTALNKAEDAVAVVETNSAKEATTQNSTKAKNNNTAAQSVIVPEKQNVVQKVKAVKEKVENFKKESNSSDYGLLGLLLLIILAFILPPLAVFIIDGSTSGRFWLTLILWLLGWGVGVAIFGIGGGLFTLLAVIIALIAVLT